MAADQEELSPSLSPDLIQRIRLALALDKVAHGTPCLSWLD
ncbi:hypothetical protein ACFLYD_07645 [Chloroflexota bacterium]